MSEPTNILRNSSLDGFRLQETVDDIDNRRRIIEAPDHWHWTYTPTDERRATLVPEVFHRSPGMEVSGGFMKWLGGFEQRGVTFKAGQRYLARGTTVQTYSFTGPHDFRDNINWRFVLTPDGGKPIYGPWHWYGGADWFNKGLEMLWSFEPRQTFTGSFRFECRCKWANTDGGMGWTNIACQERTQDEFGATVTYIDITPAAPPIPSPPPAPGYVDLLDYMRGDGRVYDVGFSFPGNQFPAGVERMQTQRDGARRFFHVKGGIGTSAANWEELFYDNEYIYRGTDISPNEAELYQETTPGTGAYGARWMVRHVTVGTRYLGNTRITFRRKSDGANVPDKAPYDWPRWIEVKAIYASHTFPNGVTLPDVIELWGYLHDPVGNKPGANYERFFYAKGYGLVGWIDPTKNPIWQAQIVATGVASPDLPRRVIPWLTLPPLAALPANPDTFPLSDTRWSRVNMTSTGLSANIRAQPMTSAAIVGQATRVAKPALVMMQESRQLSDGLWYPVRVSSGAAVDFAISGWARSDVVRFTDVIPAPPPAPEPPPVSDNTVSIILKYDKNNPQAVYLVDAIKLLAAALTLAGSDVTVTG